MIKSVRAWPGYGRPCRFVERRDRAFQACLIPPSDHGASMLTTPDI
jgi:hypothetical protein